MALNIKFTRLNDRLYDYILSHGHNADPLCAELAAETAALGMVSRMQVAADQGTLMGILAAAVGTRSAIEVGTFTGYSALCVARALPEDGHLLCLDINEEWTSIAKRYWKRGGVAHKITLTLGPAVDTLRALPADRSFDFAFIDADKQNYHIYYEEILKRLRRDGLMLVDNVLWGGRVVDPQDSSEATQAIREFNDFVRDDRRVEAVMVPVSDGLTIARKR